MITRRTLLVGGAVGGACALAGTRIAPRSARAQTVPNSAGTEPPVYADTGALARAYVQAAPERVIWGSDWPHPTEKEKPDDALLFDLLTGWAPDASTREKILVTNPATLFGFS